MKGEKKKQTSGWPDEEEKHWRNRSFSWLELGLLYSPMLTPAAASRRLKSWVLANATLIALLHEAGWHRRQRIMTPKQVGCIVEVLGEP